MPSTAVGAKKGEAALGSAADTEVWACGRPGWGVNPAFSSPWHPRAPGSRICSSAFSQVGSSFWGGLDTGLSMLEADPNIQAEQHSGEEQVKTLNKFASSDKVRHLELQNKILETKRSLLQQQKTAGSNVDRLLESSIDNLW
ncbi:hypothetical protein GH733_011902 [Mirounga leonina]|nr:hypothetical protein GH733_011902 [Mirounga leonina]